MKKKVVKIATCCLASSFVIACSAMTVGAQDSAIALPSAGISFSFNGENSLFASAISEIVNNEVNTVKSEFEKNHLKLAHEHQISPVKKEKL